MYPPKKKLTLLPQETTANFEQSHAVQQLIKDSKEILTNTNRPNVITLEQFLPYIELYRVNNELYKTDDSYRRQMTELYDQYIRNLSINLYEPIIVIQSKENPKELYFLDRLFTRIKSDFVEGKSLAGGARREKIPASAARSPGTNRESLIMNASFADLMEANTTPAAKALFARIKADSMLITKRFIERNASPEVRDKAMGRTESVDTTTPNESTGSTFFETFLDDDD